MSVGFLSSQGRLGTIWLSRACFFDRPDVNMPRFMVVPLNMYMYNLFNIFLWVPHTGIGATTHDFKSQNVKIKFAAG